MFGNNQKHVDLTATLTCPVCQAKQKVTMPTEGYQHYYKCSNPECSADLSPLTGKDCIFCSYADKSCPQRQLNPEEPSHNLQSLL